MADLFQDRSCMHWWLPNDENYPPIIRSIRKFVEERTAPAKDVDAEGLRDMKAIFTSLNLDDGQSNAPTAIKKEEVTEITVASEGPRNMSNVTGAGDGYGHGYDGQGYLDQGGESYGFPR